MNVLPFITNLSPITLQSADHKYVLTVFFPMDWAPYLGFFFVLVVHGIPEFT